tara:strand:+ start:427 stop:1158 length:732 start_codon:yes stop_codon:yes gene_type:complete
MKKSHYSFESNIEKNFWWFKVRRFFFSREIIKLINKNQTILDIGSSSGSNLRMLEEMGYQNYTGLDPSIEAIKQCKKKGFTKIVRGNACNLPFKSSSIDFIIASDVIEHIENDKLALSEIHRVLKKNSYAIITVPAFKFLWSLHDDNSMHKRRYTKKSLGDLIDNKKFEIKKFFYFNFLLFLPIFLARMIFKLLKIKIKNENKVNNKYLNNLFKIIFKFDVLIAEKINPPFGVSIFSLIKKIS